MRAFGCKYTKEREKELRHYKGKLSHSYLLANIITVAWEITDDGIFTMATIRTVILCKEFIKTSRKERSLDLKWVVNI
jgi:hypothetical protein